MHAFASYLNIDTDDPRQKPSCYTNDTQSQKNSKGRESIQTEELLQTDLFENQSSVIYINIENETHTHTH